MILLLTFLFLFATWALNGHTIIYNRWKKFRELNQLVQIKYQTTAMIFWISFKMVVKMYWISFLQWLNSSIRHIDKRTTAVSYVINGRLYTIIITTQRGPSNVLMIIDEQGNDVSDDILPYLGPNEDWHCKLFTPSFWNYKSLTFEMSSGESLTFSEIEPIDLRFNSD